MEYIASTPVHRVLCADCGTPIEPNSANLCIACLRNTVDITEGIPKQSTVNYCRNCERYLSPPQSWVTVEPESRELLAICLKKLKGLNKVRLIDAGFIWTEPHSKRIRVKLTIQKEVFTSTILQQIFEVEYVVLFGQCPDCTKLAAKNTWKAMVQVRQKVNHKRTFLYLEQLILKHNAHKDTINIKEAKDGLDFFYTQRSHAIKMVEFLNAVVPVRTKSSEQLLSTDTHSGTSSYKFTYSAEIIPICKDDLVCIPPKHARSLSNINPLTVCTRVGNSLHLLDPSTLQVTDVTSPIYWRAPFDSLATVSDMVEFLVLDIEPSGPKRGKLVLADAQVTPLNSSIGSTAATRVGDTSEETIYHTRTHLGALLQPGDTVLGYYLSRSNFNNDAYETLDPTQLPDVILVKKTFPNRRKKNKPRQWRLKSIAKEAEEGAGINEGAGGYGRGALGRRGGVDQAKVEADYELFLRELEEDPELRQNINLYKAKGGDVATAPRAAKARPAPDAMDIDDMSADDEVEEEEPDFPDVDLKELLENFDEMKIDGDQ